MGNAVYLPTVIWTSSIENNRRTLLEATTGCRLIIATFTH